MSIGAKHPHERYYPLKEAGCLFPRFLSTRSILRRIKEGIDGVKLAAAFDGYRYWLRQLDVERFMDDLSEVRRNKVRHLSEAVRTRQERARQAYQDILNM